jgi:cell shape-determining protein MreC
VVPLARANLVLVVLFFAVVRPAAAEDESLRQALDQLSVSYAESRQQLRERDAALQTLTESLAVARTESEMFQKLWAEAEVRAQSLGASLTEPAVAAQQRQLVEALRALYLAEAERQRLIEQLRRLTSAVESNRNVAGEIEVTRKLLASMASLPAGSDSTAGTINAARVLDVNPKLRLVVLDIGAQQGARVGMPLQVWRGDREIGRVRIVEVRQRVSGAMIENVENKVTMQAGDTARVTRN